MANGKKAKEPEVVGTDLVPIDSQFPALAGGSTVLEALKLNLGGEELTVFDLDRVRVPAGGAISWEVPNPDSDQPDSERELDGIIVFTKVGRSYWKDEYTGGGAPPDCSSPDMVNGYGEPGGKCAQCPLAEWGSDIKGGRGQACRQSRFVFLLRPGGHLPTVISLPPTSLKPMKKFLMRISQRGRPYWAFITRFTLTKTSNADGLAYSQVNARVVRELTVEEIAQVALFAENTRATFQEWHEGVDGSPEWQQGPDTGNEAP